MGSNGKITFTQNSRSITMEFKTKQCEDDHLFTLTLALKLQNTDELDDLIAAVSDPANTKHSINIGLRKKFDHILNHQMMQSNLCWIGWNRMDLQKKTVK
eukprot:TRINITY_DN7271_c0_g1_i1.p1 TRINITY_DN7271_c0_g1~~TRINITY_DN7271_c0_g1_i1.p1  ORF type:complete len:100 (+),score=12.40 TRINITY_DN7271_c0_g1_i1:178-477(+)